MGSGEEYFSTEIVDEEDEKIFSQNATKYETQSEFLESFLEQINEKLPDKNENEETEEIDVVIAGGGMKGYFVVGAWSVLRKLIEKKRYKVRRWAGTSVGACSAIYMCCNIDPVKWSNTYWKTRRIIKSKKLSIMEAFEHLSNKVLPENAHEICSGKVHLSITLLTLTGPKNLIVSEFFSKADLIEACVASCNIPYMTAKKTGKTFRGMRVIDGGFTNNTPVFPFSNYRQLIFHTPKVPYPSGLVLNMKDPCIDSLVIRGAFIMRQFTIGEYAPPADRALITWKEPSTSAPIIQEIPSWTNRFASSLRSFSTASIDSYPGFASAPDLSLVKPKNLDIDPTTMQKVSIEFKRTFAHYRMAIITVLFSFVLLAAPIKWENMQFWKHIFGKFKFFCFCRRVLYGRISKNIRSGNSNRISC